MQKTIKNRLAEMLGSDRMFSNRELMRYTAAFLWVATGVGTFIAGVVAPELAPDPIWGWRIGCSSVGLIAVWSQLTWMQRLDDVRVYRFTVFWLLMSITASGALMFANALAVGALFISLLAPTVFAAQFFKRRDLIWTMGLLALVAIGAVLVHYEEIQSVHLLSRVAAFVPIMWAVAFAVFALRTDTAREFAKSQVAAGIDPLTGIANLRAFEARADEVLSKRNARISGETAVLLIDLDDFKAANTIHGHAGGDHVLRSVAKGLQSAASSTHLVARIGGDEFAVIIPQVDADSAQRLARRLVEGVAECTSHSPLAACRQVTASAGFALYGLHGRTFDDLVSAADIALMSVKKSGKGTERVSSFVVSL